MQEELKAKLAVYSALLLGFSALMGLMTGVEPFHNQFYTLGSWTLALLLDSLLYHSAGASPLVSRTGEFLLLALWSIVLCSVLELLNLRLQAWYYIYSPDTFSTRWAGRAFSWAVTLPVVFTVSELLRAAGLGRGLKAEPLPFKPGCERYFYWAGAAMLLLALAVPRFFWPLAWAALIPLAEPLNFRLGLPSLLRDWTGGLPGRTLRLAAAGVISALALGCLNRASGGRLEFPAGSGPELFGIPVFLYAGCSLLAMQAYSVYALGAWLRGGKTFEDPSWTAPGQRPTAAMTYGTAAALVLLTYIAFRAVDANTVKLYLAWV